MTKLKSREWVIFCVCGCNCWNPNGCQWKVKWFVRFIHLFHSLWLLLIFAKVTTHIPKNSWRQHNAHTHTRDRSESKVEKYLFAPQRKMLIPLLFRSSKKKKCCWIKSLFIVNKPPLYRQSKKNSLTHSLPFAPQLDYHILLFLLICFAFAACKPPFDL